MSAKATAEVDRPPMTVLSPSHKLLVFMPMVLAVAIAAWPGPGAAVADRHSARSACGKPPATVSRRSRVRCRLRPNTLIAPRSRTQISAGSTLSLRFFSNRASSRFQCRVGRATWSVCRSPAEFDLANPGTYRLAVRAIGPDGQHDPTPATLVVRVAAPLKLAARRELAGKDEAGSATEPSGSPPEIPRSENLPPETPPPQGMPLEGVPFVSHGVWAEQLPADVPIDPRSAQMIQTLTAKLQEEIAAGTGPRLGADTRTPLYRVPASQPGVPIFLDTGPWGYRLAEKLAAGVPIPPGAQPVAGTDRAMAVWQVATDTYWEFFRMQEALHGPQFARAAKVTAGCALQQGTYSYEVTAFNANGETPVEGGRSAATVAEGACVEIRWGPIHGATGYRIYRGAEGSAASHLATVGAGQNFFLDDGTAALTGSLSPIANTASTPGEWHAAYGGMIEKASTSPGYYRDLVDSTGTVREQANWGAAATSLPLAAGLITREDVERGRIDHVLALGLANRAGSSIIRAGSFASPAQRSDGRSDSENSIPEGARLRLDPELNLDALPLSPFARMVAEAAQRYGMIVQDGSWSTVVYAEDPSPAIREGQPNFYEARFGRRVSRALRELPWGDLQVVQMQLCQRGPCISVDGP